MGGDLVDIPQDVTIKSSFSENTRLVHWLTFSKAQPTECLQALLTQFEACELVILVDPSPFMSMKRLHRRTLVTCL